MFPLTAMPDVGSDCGAVAGDEEPGAEWDHARVDRDHADPDRQAARGVARQVVGDGIDDERARPGGAAAVAGAVAGRRRRSARGRGS